MRKISKRGQDTIGSLSGIIQENVLGQQIVKIFGREKYEEERFGKENNLLNKTTIATQTINIKINVLDSKLLILFHPKINAKDSNYLLND